MTDRIGFIGLGVMGRPMASYLQRHGYPLTVHTRTRSRAAALLESGAPVRLRTLISDTLDRVRTASREPALPPAVGSLLRDLADGVEGRIP